MTELSQILINAQSSGRPFLLLVPFFPLRLSSLLSLTGKIHQIGTSEGLQRSNSNWPNNRIWCVPPTYRCSKFVGLTPSIPARIFYGTGSRVSNTRKKSSYKTIGRPYFEKGLGCTRWSDAAAKDWPMDSPGRQHKTKHKSQGSFSFFSKITFFYFCHWSHITLDLVVADSCWFHLGGTSYYSPGRFWFFSLPNFNVKCVVGDSQGGCHRITS